MLKKFHMNNCKPVFTPLGLNEKLQENKEEEKEDEKRYKSLVGSFIYLTNIRPDIMHFVSIVSRYMSQTTKSHFAATKRILRYLQGTKRTMQVSWFLDSV